MHNFSTYLQVSNMIVSKTRIGPVGPKMESGCPEKNPKVMPTMLLPKRVSITDILFSVASAKSPPNVINGARTAT